MTGLKGSARSSRPASCQRPARAGRRIRIQHPHAARRCTALRSAGENQPHLGPHRRRSGGSPGRRFRRGREARRQAGSRSVPLILFDRGDASAPFRNFPFVPPAHARARVVDGVLFLDKPVGISSNNALQKARWLLSAAKGGTPPAPRPDGERAVCRSPSARRPSFPRPCSTPTRPTTPRCCLGVTTTTADAEGEVLARCPVDVSDAAIEAAISASLRARSSRCRRCIPASSITARRFTSMPGRRRDPREPRRVTIYRFDLLARRRQPQGPGRMQQGHRMRARWLRGSRRLLGCGAHLTALRRKRDRPVRSGRGAAAGRFRGASGRGAGRAAGAGGCAAAGICRRVAARCRPGPQPDPRAAGAG